MIHWKSMSNGRLCNVIVLLATLCVEFIRLTCPQLHLDSIGFCQWHHGNLNCLRLGPVQETKTDSTLFYRGFVENQWEAERLWGASSTNRKMDGSTPDSSWLWVEVSLSKTLNPKLLLMGRPMPHKAALSPSVSVCVNGWMRGKCKTLWVCR